MKIIKNNLITATCLVAVLIALSFFWPLNKAENNTADLINAANEKSAVKNPKESEAVQEIKLEAKSACVFDVLKKEYIFKKNANAQLPLASLTKLMTAIVAKENFLPGTLIKISDNALSQDGDNGFMKGDMWNLTDITNAMLISSSNDAAFAVSEARSDFMSLMEKTAKKLGLSQTYFLNPTGLDISENLAGAYGSCEDMVKIMNYMLQKHRDILEITAKETYESHGLVFKNTDKLVPELPTLIAVKTGFDDLPGGNLIVAVDKGMDHPIIIVVLGSTFEGRFTDVRTLYNAFAK